MTQIGLIQIIILLAVVLILTKPLGWYMAMVYEGKAQFLRPLEQFFYRLTRIDPDSDMNWKEYLFAILWFNLFGLLFLYIIQRLQAYLPCNPQRVENIPSMLAFNTAASFVTNTDWQAYPGETTMSYLTQMMGLTSQNFLSAATGMSLLIALIRGLVGVQGHKIGNFWVDTFRGILYILLPLAMILSLVLVSQGVIQNLKPNQIVHIYQTHNQAMQIIPMGPVASQVAIKQLGSNGGGFFNTNSAHPFENPTPLSNFLEMLAMILIPASLTYTYGRMIQDQRQGWALFMAMSIIFVPCLFVNVLAEQAGNPALTTMNIQQTNQADFPGGNMEGKETRFGIVSSALWTVITTSTSNGSVNSMLDSYTPIGGLVPLWMMQLGEIIFGGVGTGLTGMILVVILTVFIGGLMVGRTPEYLGKKIEPFEMKMASVAVLMMPIFVLCASALNINLPSGKASLGNPGPHGLTEMLYAFTSMFNNNGSAFSGLNGNTPFINLVGGVLMLIGRYWIAIPTLAIAGSLVKKKVIPSSSGTLVTDSPVFIILLMGIILLLGALSFLPVLALGPIVEQIMFWNNDGSSY